MSLTENLVFGLNATLPVFIIILVGMAARKLGLVNDNYVEIANRFNFRVSLPIMLFMSMKNSDIAEAFDAEYVVLIVLCTVGELLVAAAAARVFVRNRYERGSFAQGAFRGNTALIGLAMINNMYGESVFASISLMSAIPVYNAGAVVLLSLFPQRGETRRRTAGEVIKGIVTNPLIIGTLAGIAASVIRLRFPAPIETSLKYLSDMTMGTALICIGASLDLSAFNKKKGTAGLAAVMKLIVLPLIFIPVIAAAGYKTDALASAFIVLGSPTAVNSYIMAVSMNQDSDLASAVVVMTSFFGALTMTAWISVMRSMGLL